MRRYSFLFILAFLLQTLPSRAADPPVRASVFSPACEEEKKAAKTLLGRWLEVQNRGDFAGYQALYAADFSGVRRSGSKRVDLDRVGWLKDRERMFKSPMIVSTADEVVDRTPHGGLRLLFTQTWESGSYKDVGKKELLLLFKEGGYLISREEMLSSLRKPAVAPSAELDHYGRLLLFDYDPKKSKREPDDPIPLSVKTVSLTPELLAVVLLAGPFSEKEEKTATLAVVRISGRPKVLAKDEFDVTGNLRGDMPPTSRTHGKHKGITLELIDLGDVLPSLSITDVEEYDEPTSGLGHRVETARLYRFVNPKGGDASLTELLSYVEHETRDDPECEGPSERAEMRILSSKSQGLRNLQVVVTKRTSNLVMKRRNMECIPKQERERTIYKFDGTRYIGS